MASKPTGKSERVAEFRRRMKRAEIGWNLLGLGAIAVSLFILGRQLQSISFSGLQASLLSIDRMALAGSALAAMAAYLLLASYDLMALKYLRRQIRPAYALASGATAFAVSHTIGASVLSGALLRYRAYSAKGVPASEVMTMVAFCLATFVLGMLFVGGIVFVIDPYIADRLTESLPLPSLRTAGQVMVGLCLLYVAFSFLPLGNVRVAGMTISYPPPGIALCQLSIAAAEILSASLVIYLVLPAENNPGLLVTAGIFTIAFAAALVSHAPAGLGVFELIFMAGLSEMAKEDVLAALLVFRLFYFIVPFLLSVVAIAIFQLRVQRAIG